MRVNQLMNYHPLLGRSLLELNLDQALNLENEYLNLAKNSWMPAVDIEETNKEFLVKADVPGMTKANIDVSMDNSCLTIQGKRQFEKKEEKKNAIRTERFTGEFYRRFTLPDSADANKISATCKDGVLSIIIPKRTASKTLTRKKITIQ